MKKNVVLIGMPGVGKSTAGVILSKVLGYQFVDTDLLIQKKAQKRLWQIIEEEGIDAFLALEDQVNSSLDVTHSVIAPGGSVVYNKKSMEHYKEIATIVFLEADFQTIESRLGNFNHRGIVCHKGKTLRDVYDERLPLYKQYADITIHEKNNSLSQVVSDIVSAIDGYCEVI